jgi:hypothetical protein
MGGITRKVLDSSNHNAASIDEVVKNLFVRLRDIYGVTPPSGNE